MLLIDFSWLKEQWRTFSVFTLSGCPFEFIIWFVLSSYSYSYSLYFFTLWSLSFWRRGHWDMIKKLFFREILKILKIICWSFDTSVRGLQLTYFWTRKLFSEKKMMWISFQNSHFPRGGGAICQIFRQFLGDPWKGPGDYWYNRDVWPIILVCFP